jgi:hypothetical protein
VAIAQPPETVGGGHEALRIPRKRDRLARAHCDMRRVTPSGQHLVLVKHGNREAGIDERTEYGRQ